MGTDRQAFVVVVLSTLALGVGKIANSGASGILWSSLHGIALWYVWALVSYFIGTLQRRLAALLKKHRPDLRFTSLPSSSPPPGGFPLSDAAPPGGGYPGVAPTGGVSRASPSAEILPTASPGPRPPTAIPGSSPASGNGRASHQRRCRTRLAPKAGSSATLFDPD